MLINNKYMHTQLCLGFVGGHMNSTLVSVFFNHILLRMLRRLLQFRLDPKDYLSLSILMAIFQVNPG